MKTLLFILLSSFVGVACQSFDRKAEVDKIDRKYSSIGSIGNSWITHKWAGMVICKTGPTPIPDEIAEEYLRFSRLKITNFISSNAPGPTVTCPREMKKFDVEYRIKRTKVWICPLVTIYPDSSCLYSCPSIDGAISGKDVRCFR